MEQDKQHWSKFSAWTPYKRSFNKEEQANDFSNSDVLFMRWKELFLVPDHSVRCLDGASYDGFYYVCYRLSTGTLEGFYYHQSSEWFQSLVLQQVMHFFLLSVLHVRYVPLTLVLVE